MKLLHAESVRNEDSDFKESALEFLKDYLMEQIVYAQMRGAYFIIDREIIAFKGWKDHQPNVCKTFVEFGYRVNVDKEFLFITWMTLDSYYKQLNSARLPGKKTLSEAIKNFVEHPASIRDFL